MWSVVLGLIHSFDLAHSVINLLLHLSLTASLRFHQRICEGKRTEIRVCQSPPKAAPQLQTYDRVVGRTRAEPTTRPSPLGTAGPKLAARGTKLQPSFLAPFPRLGHLSPPWPSPVSPHFYTPHDALCPASLSPAHAQFVTSKSRQRRRRKRRRERRKGIRD